MGKTLIEILEQFENNKKNWEGTWNENAVAECFMDCAIDLLCNGYFLVNNEYIIDLGAIELYYHEEDDDGNIKDPIMYHTNAHSSNSRILELNNKEFPYFKFGSFNLHQSGVDVTFENPDKKYRASFLIRSYRILKAKDGKYPQNDTTKYDPHSTHIFDDMFYSGLLLFDTEKDKKNTIEWKDDKPRNVEFDKEKNWRINVPEYKKENGVYIKDGKGNYIKDDVIISDEEKIEMKDAQKNKKCPKYFKSGTKYYRQDMRPWRFQLKDIE